MAAPLSIDEATARLNEVVDAMKNQFPRNVARLEQLEHHLTTAAMAVEHLFDEQARADFARAERIRKAETEE